MDVFDLDEAVIDRYKAFARSFTDIRSPELNTKVDELYATKRFWPELLIQLNPHYADGGSIQDFIEAGDLEPECAEVFRDQSAIRRRTKAIAYNASSASSVSDFAVNRSAMYFWYVLLRCSKEESRSGV